jgi:hypothetical protein
MSLLVRIWGMDVNSRLFKIEAHTVDLTPVGARLEHVRCPLQRGMVIGVECGSSRSRFRVSWVGQPGTPKEDQIGIRCIEPGKYIWGVPLARKFEDQYGEDFRAENAS